jgi:hypothetical protein
MVYDKKDIGLLNIKYACCYFVQSILSCRVLSIKLAILILNTVILLIVLWLETFLLLLVAPGIEPWASVARNSDH